MVNPPNTSTYGPEDLYSEQKESERYIQSKISANYGAKLQFVYMIAHIYTATETKYIIQLTQFLEFDWTICMGSIYIK